MKTLKNELWEKILSLNFDFLQQKMTSKFDWSKERAENAVKRYKQYLYIVYEETKPVCPTKDVDEVWHQHILHTRQYEEHCHTIFGKMLHHEPFGSSGDKILSEALELYDLGPQYFEDDYPKGTQEEVSRECCSDDSECCSTKVKISVE